MRHDTNSFQKLILCAISVVGICRAQSMDFRHPQQQQPQMRNNQQPSGGGIVGVGTLSATDAAAQRQQQQQRQPNLKNPYDPMLLPLYGHQQNQQQQNGRGIINNRNNGTWSAIGSGTFGAGAAHQMMAPVDAGQNGTTMAFGEQQRMFGASGSSEIGGGAVGHGHGPVQVQVQLRSYANPGFRLPDSRLCTCPAGNERCLHASPQRNGYNCLTSLAVFVLSADDTIHFEETPYFPLNAAGQLGQQQEFGTPLRFHLNSEPSAIAVVAHNLGPQINMDGSLYETNTVTVVDTFVQPLLTSSGGAVPSFAGASRAAATAGTKMLLPFAGGGGGGQLQQQQMHHVQLQGRVVGTQLSLAFSVTCRGQLVGPGCDLACNSSAANPSTAICQSRRTGFFSLCRWINGGGQQQQVSDCKNCPWGIKENAYCADGEGGVLEPNHAGVVSSSYYTAFIVLSCVCGLLLLCMLAACLITFKKVVRVRRDMPASFRRHQQLAAAGASRAAANGTGGNGTAAAPLITRGDPERVLLTAGMRPTECDADDGGFNAAFRLGTGGAKAPPPPYSLRSNGSAAFGGTDQRSAAAVAPVALPDVPSRTSPFPLPRSGTTSVSGGRDTPSVLGASAGGRGGERQRFPPPLAIGGSAKTVTTKALSPPRFQPLPHLGPQQQQLRRSPVAGGTAVGGGAVVADSLNSSFAGGGGASVSADV
ncbi:hypothetical protein niasHT_037835 [Heterodera trifolii]|uniref:Uncharacterized protein n=1 Tax=Heterodera trifolii TaxID=157864 RepID=A0ABD2ISS7_9BILA